MSLDGVVPHEPAFIGENKVRARLHLRNKGTGTIFVEAFALTTARNDSALLDDVFEGEQCRQAENDANRNDDPGVALGIGYSRLHTFGILEIHAGKSLQFSVPLDHLSEGRCVRIRYWTETATPPSSRDRYRFLWLGPSQ